MLESIGIDGPTISNNLGRILDVQWYRVRLNRLRRCTRGSSLDLMSLRIVGTNGSGRKHIAEWMGASSQGGQEWQKQWTKETLPSVQGFPEEVAMVWNLCWVRWSPSLTGCFGHNLGCTTCSSISHDKTDGARVNDAIAGRRLFIKHQNL